MAQWDNRLLNKIVVNRILLAIVTCNFEALQLAIPGLTSGRLAFHPADDIQVSV